MSLECWAGIQNVYFCQTLQGIRRWHRIWSRKVKPLKVLLHRCSYPEVLWNPTCRAKKGRKVSAGTYFLAQDWKERPFGKTSSNSKASTKTNCGLVSPLASKSLDQISTQEYSKTCAYKLTLLRNQEQHCSNSNFLLGLLEKNLPTTPLPFIKYWLLQALSEDTGQWRRTGIKALLHLYILSPRGTPWSYSLCGSA